ncbi:FapA family protein [Eubacteriaceae bacterium ES3]|nr:FapA family protein [Eubacteriaceae bacterium ES3]
MDEIKGGAEEAKQRIEVLISEDGMTGFVKINKEPDEENIEVTSQDIFDALEAQKVVYGIQEETVEKLAGRPIFNLKMKVAEGMAPIDGADATFTCYVKPDGEYKPVFDDEEKIDYKNTSHFQMVDENQVLCRIDKETKGNAGKTVLGDPVPAKDGRKAAIKEGKNTYFSDDQSQLIAKCDGIVKFIGNTIHVNDMLQVPGNVDILSGNINFPGDVTVNGDVCSGFRVKCGGDLVIKGVIEDAEIDARGNVLVAQGINGNRDKKIRVQKELRSKYIENALIEVHGDVFADYIIESQVQCEGNIVLSGQKELIVGGSIELTGDLKAKDIGTDREKPTKITIVGVPTPDLHAIAECDEQISLNKMELTKVSINEKSVNKMLLDQEKKSIAMKKTDRQALEKIALMLKDLSEQKQSIEAEISKFEEKKDEIVKKTPIEYFGSISCKRKLYQGVKIYFGDELFHFESDNLDHCRIYWMDDKIILGML